MRTTKSTNKQLKYTSSDGDIKMKYEAKIKVYAKFIIHLAKRRRRKRRHGILHNILLITKQDKTKKKPSR
jgi:hypothetical protein